MEKEEGKKEEKEIREKEEGENLETDKQSDKQEKQKKLDRQVKIVLTVIIVLAVLLISFMLLRENISDFIKRQTGTKFEYHGIEYEIYKEKNMTFYRGILFVNRENVIKYNLFLRNDPRDLDRIPVPENISDISLKKWAYISFSPEMLECKNSVLASWRISEFMTILGITPQGAVTELTNSTKQGNAKVKTCEDAIGANVVLFKEGEKNRITHKDDCFVLEVKDCNILEVSERFTLFLIDMQFRGNRTQSF